VTQSPGKFNVSVALATFNGEAWLPKQLDSILDQTWPVDEIVIRDDGSTDHTCEIIKRFQDCGAVATLVLESDGNLRSTTNFERIIRHCSGDIIFLADQDDAWAPQKVERICNAFADHPEIGFVFSNADVVDDSLNSLGYDLWSSVYFVPPRRGSEYFNLLPCLIQRNVVTGATMAFRSSFRDRIPIAPPGWFHDEWIAWCLSLVAPAYAINEPLIQYRQHPSQQIGASRPGIWSTLARWRNKHGVDFNESLLTQLRRIAAMQQTLVEHLTDSQVTNEYTKRILADADRQLDEIQQHLTTRIRIRKSSISGLADWVQEIMSGRYHKFGSGWGTSIRDILRA
jgi:glycosyltransferase involved in cell wall biosynthesis